MTDGRTLFPESDYTYYHILSPVDAFEVFFSEKIVKIIVTESTKYALSRASLSQNLPWLIEITIYNMLVYKKAGNDMQQL